MPSKVLLIDNYDSFVFNLSRYLEELGVETEVARNDEISIAKIGERRPAAVVLSPGPCTPNEAGITLDLLRELGDEIPMLGVCLGHQALGAAFGGRVIRAAEPVHGRTSLIRHHGTGLFANCPSPLRVTRYHSLIVERETLPNCLEVTAQTDDGVIMGLSHREYRLYGVQFHPESILTQQGHQLLKNFLQLAEVPTVETALNGDLPAVPEVEVDFFQKGIEAAVFRPL